MTKDKTATSNNSASCSADENKKKSTKGSMRDKYQERPRGKEDFQDRLNKRAAKDKEKIIPNAGKITSNRNVSLDLSLSPFLSMSPSTYPSPSPSPSLSPSPNGEVARKIFTGDDSSPMGTTSSRKSKDTPNYSAMDMEEDLKPRITITEKK